MAVRIDQMTSFTYTTYIHATPERVWQGLTDPAVTRRYWRHQKAGEKTFRSDWKKGSTYALAHEEVGLVVSDPEQVILESDPCRRLAYTWHTFTPEWAAQVGMDEATADAWRAEPRSKVAFDIEDTGHGVVKLTVIHDSFEPGSDVLQAISNGWPAVLASLKTLLETGTALPGSWLCHPNEVPSQLAGSSTQCHSGPHWSPGCLGLRDRSGLSVRALTTEAPNSRPPRVGDLFLRRLRGWTTLCDRRRSRPAHKYPPSGTATGRRQTGECTDGMSSARLPRRGSWP
jgi:uncharacterized protein YndB with AHSA1/START domain